MKPALVALCLLLLGAATSAQQDKKQTPVKFVLPQMTGAQLEMKKVKAVEVITEAGPAQALTNVLGAQGEPPIAAGKYFPQTLVMDLEGNLRIQDTAFFEKPLPKGSKLILLRPLGNFTAESGKKILKLMAFEGKAQR